MEDARKRGRMLRKLTLTQSIEVDDRIEAGEPLPQLAREFGVTYQAVYNRRARIIRGLMSRHLSDQLAPFRLAK